MEKSFYCKITKFVFVCLLLINQGFGQQSCELDLLNPNLLLSNYIPDNITTPIKTIPISFHIWRKNDGTGNYWQDLQAYRDTLKTMVNSLSDVC